MSAGCSARLRERAKLQGVSPTDSSSTSDEDLASPEVALAAVCMATTTFAARNLSTSLNAGSAAISEEVVSADASALPLPGLLLLLSGIDAKLALLRQCRVARSTMCLGWSTMGKCSRGH